MSHRRSSSGDPTSRPSNAPTTRSNARSPIEHGKLRKSVAIHQAVLEASLDGVIVFDENRQVIGHSRRFVDIWKLAPEDMAVSIRERVTPHVADPHLFLARIEEINRTDDVIQEEIRLLDGRILDRVSAPIRSDDGVSHGRVWFFRDITESLRKGTELLHAKEIAENASRAKSDFLRNMSHEMRTPLNAAIGFARILAREIGEQLAPVHQEFLRDMLQAGEHMLDLVNALLDLRNLEETTIVLAPLALRQVIDETISILQPLIDERGVAVSLVIAEEIPLAMANHRAVKQILINLVSNAAKFTHAGGTVSIDALATESRLHITVRDTGIGIAPEDQATLFTYSEQASGKHVHHMTGSGVGLALTRALVERQGGAIAVHSIVGSGSAFTFDLQVAS